MAEQLAFQQGFVQGRAIDLHVWLSATGAGGMDGSGHHLLAGTAFTINNDRGIGAGGVSYQFEHLLHGFALTPIMP